MLAWLPFHQMSFLLRLKAWCVTAKALPGVGASCSHCRKTLATTVTYTASQPRYAPEIIDMAMRTRRMSRQCTHYGRWPSTRFYITKKLQPQ
ncbi:hypothetical protein ACLK17_12915 [Escherichia coli]